MTRPVMMRPLKPREIQEINRERMMVKEDFQRSIAANEGILRKAQWENQADKANVKRQTKEMLEAKARKHQEELLARRRRLADLFNQEFEGWRQELLSRVETTEDRKQKIREKAYALQARNEAARQAYVKECYDRRWRDANDDARLLDGKALLRFVTDARLQQIQEKMDRKEKIAQEDQKYYQEILKHVEKMDRVEAEKEARREQRKMETVATLEEQIRRLNERKERHRERVSAEDEQEIRMIEAELQKEKEKLEARKRVAYERGKEVRSFNDARLGIRKAKKEQEQQQDLSLLAYAVAKESAEEEAEKAKREKAKHEALAYQQYLKDLMIKEAEDETAIEEIRKKQEDEVWDKRDAVQDAQRKARERLMRLVHDGRQDQIRHKALTEEEEAKLEAMQVAKWREDIVRGLEEDRMKADARRLADQQNNVFLQKQMEERRRRAQFETQQEYLMLKHMQKEEEEHLKRQRDQAGKVRLHFPVPHTQWNS